MEKSILFLLAYPLLAGLIPLAIKTFFLAEEKLSKTFNNDYWEKSYDYIIVGASAAGCVLANRLSEDPNKKVLLLEAGGPTPSLSEIPALSNIFQGSVYSWNFKTVQQEKSCFSMHDRRCRFIRGKGLGGTTMFDSMIYLRGHPDEYNSWSTLGLREWRWEKNFPYFIKVEQKRDANLYDTNRNYGTNGYLPVNLDPFENIVTKSIRTAAAELGLPYGDPNAVSNVINARPQFTHFNGTRFSASKAYLEPIMHRPNLKILTFSRVNRVIFDGKRAIGVEFNRHGLNHFVATHREVILSAGPINSPKILMLSGIGPRQLIEEHRMEVIADLKGVGKNLVSPLCAFSLSYKLENVPRSILKDQYDYDTINEYVEYGKGRLATTGYDSITIAQSNVYGHNDTGHWPDIALLLYSGGLVADDGLFFRKNIGLNSDVWAKVFEPNIKTPSFTLAACLARPRSRGTVNIISADPDDDPDIDPKYNEHPSDLQSLTNALKLAKNLGKTRVFRDLGAVPYSDKLPTCREFALYTEPYLACSAQSLTVPSEYISGTCRMGDPKDPFAVVDQNLKVLGGIIGLRVADASVFPSPPGLSSGPEYMLGERLADIIRSRRPPIHPYTNPIYT
ncbi:glucose dehydrogenase [FAD, quinone] [Tetranychus urticae]|uniref:Glucose-methanol-choline oxidoreductase N-terminal domain-containing protein n=1 Tax=Tetranychus urticae TaxID=32264 RepID=T1K0W6_TETUR|nr:glucose dehydrogenase [FAD, quinone] [Tetranychus urticae]